MLEHQYISNHLDDSIFIRLKKYDEISLIEKYFLYIDIYRFLEVQLCELMSEKLYGNIKKLSNKTFGQLIRLLKNNQDYQELFLTLKKIINDQNRLYEIFWVDKIVAQSMGETVCLIDEKILDEAVYEIEKVYLFLNSDAFFKI